MSDRPETDAERSQRYAALEADAPALSTEAYRKHSRRAVLTGGAAALFGAGSFRWVQTRPLDDRTPDVLRRGHEFNEALWRTVSRDGAKAPTFDRDDSATLRVNGRHGIRSDIDLAAWTMTVVGPDGSELGQHTLDDIRSLPKHEMIVEHKCVEGWSHRVRWGGARFSDFADLYSERLGAVPRFVGLETPDGVYYVGMDIESMMHSQTLLTYELGGEPLTPAHGAPLRLTTPNKYGIKNLKRIGRITFTNEQPADYWAERGYDWYAQL